MQPSCTDDTCKYKNWSENMRLMIAEKYSQAEWFIEAGVVPDDTHIVLTVGFGLWRFKIPNISFSEVPYTQDPQIIEPMSNRLLPYLVYTPNKSTLKGVGMNSQNKDKPIYDKSAKDKQLSELVCLLKKNLNEYEEIIICVDNDRTGMWGASQLLEKLPYKQTTPVYCIEWVASDKKTLQKAWDSRTQNIWKENGFGYLLAAEHEVKKHFDYWWNCNSMLVFNELCKEIGLSTTTLMSKYEVMLIFIVSQLDKPVSSLKLIKIMEKWSGTGKYSESRLWGRIGSAASKVKIIENALSRGILIKDRELDNAVTLSILGNEFIKRVHPKTFDPDLPFRLDKWCLDRDFESAKHYINTLFGRQLRFQRKESAL